MPVDRDPTPCPACRLHRWLCVCALAPRIATRTSLVLIVHIHDLGRTSNTVRLLALAVRDATFLCHGAFPHRPIRRPTYPRARPRSCFTPPRGQAADAGLVASLRRSPALIVPDGNWKQASRMVKRPAASRRRRKGRAPNPGVRRTRLTPHRRGACRHTRRWPGARGPGGRGGRRAAPRLLPTGHRPHAARPRQAPARRRVRRHRRPTLGGRSPSC